MNETIKEIKLIVNGYDHVYKVRISKGAIQPEDVISMKEFMEKPIDHISFIH